MIKALQCILAYCLTYSDCGLDLVLGKGLNGSFNDTPMVPDDTII